jgi:hypothetical protein
MSRLSSPWTPSFCPVVQSISPELPLLSASTSWPCTHSSATEILLLPSLSHWNCWPRMGLVILLVTPGLHTHWASLVAWQHLALLIPLLGPLCACQLCSLLLSMVLKAPTFISPLSYRISFTTCLENSLLRTRGPFHVCLQTGLLSLPACPPSAAQPTGPLPPHAPKPAHQWSPVTHIKPPWLLPPHTLWVCSHAQWPSTLHQAHQINTLLTCPGLCLTSTVFIQACTASPLA